MSSVIYYDKIKEDNQELKAYTDSDSYRYATAILTPFLEAFIEDGYAIAEKENNFYIRSKKNDGVVGFFFEFDKESKELVSIVLTINGTEYEYLTIMDLTTISTNEDIVFPICLALDVA